MCATVTCRAHCEHVACAERALARQVKVEAREAKRETRKEPEPPPEPPEDWQAVPGEDFWLAKAVDGHGHHDGLLLYDVAICVDYFGASYIPGGQARFLHINGGDRKIFTLPVVAPAAGTVLNFRLPVCLQGAAGRVAIVRGLEVRRAP